MLEASSNLDIFVGVEFWCLWRINGDWWRLV